MRVNMNDTVRVKLNDRGREIHREFWEPYARGNYVPPQEDAEGWSRHQLWQLMETFGPHISAGMDILFETEIDILTD